MQKIGVKELWKTSADEVVLCIANTVGAFAAVGALVWELPRVIAEPSFDHLSIAGFIVGYGVLSALSGYAHHTYALQRYNIG